MKSIILVFIVLVFAGCMGKAPVTDRSQVMLISQNEELALGEKSYKEFLSKAKLSTNKVQISRVRTIGNRIAKAANRKDFKWEFNLVEDDQINAFCLPGGKVIVYTGIMKIAQNDDQLATVMSHEVAHALARHGAERMSHQQISGVVKQLGSILVGSAAPEYAGAFDMAYGYGTQLGIMLPYSRSHEHEADEIGIHLMKKAGYNVNEAIIFWKNMKKVKDGKAPPEFLSTHPSDDNRIQKISETIKKIN
ncbi:M48 family metallopeptidase [Sulfurimonas sp.]